MKLINTERFYLETPQDPKTWLHLASIHHNIREFMCFANTRSGQVYIEEITGGHLELIEDDVLFQELHGFLCMHGVLDMTRPLFSDFKWLRGGNYPTRNIFDQKGK